MAWSGSAWEFAVTRLLWLMVPVFTLFLTLTGSVPLPPLPGPVVLTPGPTSETMVFGNVPDKGSDMNRRHLIASSVALAIAGLPATVIAEPASRTGIQIDNAYYEIMIDLDPLDTLKGNALGAVNGQLRIDVSVPPSFTSATVLTTDRGFRYGTIVTFTKREVETPTLELVVPSDQAIPFDVYVNGRLSVRDGKTGSPVVVQP